MPVTRSTVRWLLFVFAFWTVPVALGFTRALVAGPGSELAQTPLRMLGMQASLWYPWVILTPVVWVLGQRLGPPRLRWPLAVPAFMLLGVAVCFAYALLSTPGRFLAAASVPGGFLESVWSLFLHKSHVQYFIYCAVLGFGLYRAARSADEKRDVPDRIVIKTPAEVVVVPLAEINFVSAADQYVEIHASDRALLSRESLSTMEKRLPSDSFYRIHRSTIVNLQQVDRLESGSHGEYRVLLRGGQALRASRSRSPGLRRRLTA